MAVLMPSRLPLTSTSAPPELPGLMAASVWMKFSKVLMPELVAAERADDARGHGLADAERVADRQHRRRRPAARRRRRRRSTGSLSSVDLQHGEVGLGVGADHLARAALRPSLSSDLDVVGAFDHVVVGQQVAVAARRSRPSRGRPAARRSARRSPKKKRNHGSSACGLRAARLAGGDADHRRRGPLGRGAVAGAGGAPGRQRRVGSGAGAHDRDDRAGRLPRRGALQPLGLQRARPRTAPPPPR